MPKKIDRKRITPRAEVRLDAWKEGAPKVEFMGVTETAMSGKMPAVDAKTETFDDLKRKSKCWMTNSTICMAIWRTRWLMSAAACAATRTLATIARYMARWASNANPNALR